MASRSLDWACTCLQPASMSMFCRAGTKMSASPVNPSMLAAATAAHQASLQAPAAPDTSAIGPLRATAAPASGSSPGDRSPTRSSTKDCRTDGKQHQVTPAPGSSLARLVKDDGLGHDDHGGVLHEAPSSASVSGTSQPAAEHTPSILRQTAAALGLWEQLHETASTPSTVLSSQAARMRAAAAQAAPSASTDQSAA